MKRHCCSNWRNRAASALLGYGFDLVVSQLLSLVLIHSNRLRASASAPVAVVGMPPVFGNSLIGADRKPAVAFAVAVAVSSSSSAAAAYIKSYTRNDVRNNTENDVDL